MPRMVFWDTTAFVALGNRRDGLHQLAAEISSILAAESAIIVTTDAVLTETVNTFSQASWRSMAALLIQSLEQSIQVGSARLVHIDESLWKQGWHLFMERMDKDWSLTDCISFVVMEDQDIRVAFTADRHFEQAGYTRLMKPG